MNDGKPIDPELVQPEPSQAVAVRQEGAISTRPMTVDELHRNLEFIRQVMQKEMKEGVDYGKIPGCGPKPSLLQPGAQKLCMVFQLQDLLKKEEVREFPGSHREYAITVTLISATGRQWDGVGTCSTLESKYRYRKMERQCPECGCQTIIQGKAEYGGGWLCFKKKGGCGAKFNEDDQRITSQQVGTVEYENPPDYWNTARKMAFKRALVHASINATNTSELWTQDVEEMVENRPPGAPAEPTPSNVSIPTTKTPARPQSAPNPAPGEQEPKGKPATLGDRKQMIWSLKAAPGQPNRQIVTEYFRKVGPPAQLMPNEELEDLPLRFVPGNDKQRKDLHEQISRFADGEPAAAAFPPNPEPDQTPAKEQAKSPRPKAQSNVMEIRGTITNITAKTGESRKGPWVLYGVCIDGRWFNTFSKSIGEKATQLQNQQVVLQYEEGERGNTVVSIEPL